MDIELISLEELHHKEWAMWAISFTVKIGEGIVTGRGFNYATTHDHKYGIKLIFDNPNVRKDPRYKEIRTNILELISKHENAAQFCSMTYLEHEEIA
jgi:hypothetical protein